MTPPIQTGFGLRTPHVAQILEEGIKVDLIECVTENHMGRGGRMVAVLEKIRQDTPLIFHGVSLSIGNTSEIPSDYLNHLKNLVQRFNPLWLGDHFCFSGHAGNFGHDLWPLAFTQETVKHLVARIAHVQEFIARPLVLENVSSYIEHRRSEMSEVEFIVEVANQSGCEILLDVNNVYVNSKNHHFDAVEFISKIPTVRIRQIHLAGHTNMGTHLFDTHNGPVIDPVWELYRETIRLHGAVPTIIEWDENVPTLHRLIEESERARQMALQVFS